MPAHPTPRQCFVCACGDHVWTTATQGYVVLASPCDLDLLLERSWCAAKRDRTVYAQANMKGRVRRYLHQVIGVRIGWTLVGEVDHENTNGLDNRRRNLRTATRAQNSWNTRAKPGSSQFKGVHRSRGRWVAQITLGGVCRHLGSYPTEEGAARAYDLVAVEAFGDRARLNFGREA